MAPEAHGGIFAPPDRFARVLGHANHRGRGMHTHACAYVGRRRGERSFDDLRITHEDQLEGGIGDQGAQRAGNTLRRTAVTTHHIDGD
jgi:hypothetical protein